jgi:hypothetical protein
MIDAVAVIFSKDRPIQLTATLETLKKNWVDLENTEVYVLYKNTTLQSKKLYRQIKHEFDWVKFKEERNFKTDLLDILENKKFVLFVVDDCIFTDNFNLVYICEDLEKIKNSIGFSLRLGKNITYCYPVDKEQKLEVYFDMNHSFISFDWTHSEFDFGYPLELSSSIYQIEKIWDLLVHNGYSNPNALESNLDWFSSKLKSKYPVLLSYNKSRAFCVPANKVQNICNNRSMNNSKYTPEKLLEMYEQGWRIDVSKFDKFLNNSCHQECEFDFIHSSNVQSK